MSSSLDTLDIQSYITEGTKPSDSTIEKAYNGVLEAQLVPPNVRENLASKMTLDKKWDTVLAYHSMIGNAQITQQAAFGDSDRALIKALKTSRKRPDITQILQLKSRICTSNKTWMEAFVDANGIDIMIHAMEARLSKVPMGELDAAILFELICSVKAIINNGMTMQKFLNTNNALRTLTFSLLFEWKPLVLQVLEVLSVICDYSNDAAALIVKYLRHLGRLRREPPFQLLAQAIIDADVDVKAAVMLLINNLLAGTDKLSDRMVLRNDLKALRFGKICEVAVDDLEDELESIVNRASISGAVDTPPLAHRSIPRGTSNEEGYDMRASESSKTFRKERMRHKHPSETNFKFLFEEEIEQVADDGETPINPNQGIMAGQLSAGKNRFNVTKSLMKDFGSKTTKTRFFYLNGETLQWWAPGEDWAKTPPHGVVEAMEIQEVRPYSTNEDLYSISPHTFDIVTSSRVHSFSSPTEEAKESWIIALNTVRDKAMLRKCSYTLLSSDLDSHEFEISANMFRKQIAVFEAIGLEDYKRSITKSGVDVTDVTALVQFLHAELSASGLNDKLMELMQELIFVPSDSEFGEIFWTKLVSICHELRALEKDKKSSGQGPSLKSYTLDTETVKKMLGKKEKTSSGKVAVEVSKLTLELYTRNAEIERLQKEVESMRKHAVDVPVMRQKANTMKLPGSAGFSDEIVTKPIRARTSEFTMAQVYPPSSLTGGNDSVQHVMGSSPPSTVSTSTQSTQTDIISEPTVAPLHSPKDTLEPQGTKPPPPHASVPSPSTDTPEDCGNAISSVKDRAKDSPLAAMFAAKAPPASAESIKSRAAASPLAAMLQSKLPAVPEEGKTANGVKKLSVAGASPLAAMLQARTPPGMTPAADSSKPTTSTTGTAVAVPQSSRPVPAAPALPSDAGTILGAKASGQTGGAPPVPNMAAIIGGKKKSNVPESKHKPTRKMKALFWSKLQGNATSNSAIWSKVDMKKLDDMSLDYGALEEAFSQSDERASASIRSSMTSKPTTISLLDGKRTQNVLISAGRIRKTPEAMVSMAISLDPSQLTLELTEIMQSLVPSAEEIASLRGFGGNVMELGKAEKLLLALGNVPRLKERLDYHRTVFTWDRTADSLTAANSVVSRACKELVASEATTKLSVVLSVVLAVGNFMNGGSSRVATAVKLDSLLKLNNVKAAGGHKGTLLHFVVRQLKQNYPEAVNFYESWTCVSAASEVSFSQVQSDVNTLKGDVERIEGELTTLRSMSDTISTDILETAEARFGPFVDRAHVRVGQLSEAINTTAGSITSAASTFGEVINPTSGGADGDTCQAFFRTLAEVVHIFRRAVEDVDQWDAEEAKRLQRSNTRESSVSPAPESSELKTDSDSQTRKDNHDNLFGRFRNQQEASTDDIINQLKAKMKLRKLKEEAD